MKITSAAEARRISELDISTMLQDINERILVAAAQGKCKTRYLNWAMDDDRRGKIIGVLQQAGYKWSLVEERDPTSGWATKSIEISWRE